MILHSEIVLLSYVSKRILLYDAETPRHEAGRFFTVQSVQGRCVPSASIQAPAWFRVPWTIRASCIHPENLRYNKDLQSRPSGVSPWRHTVKRIHNPENVHTESYAHPFLISNTENNIFRNSNNCSRIISSTRFLRKTTFTADGKGGTVRLRQKAGFYRR